MLLRLLLIYRKIKAPATTATTTTAKAITTPMSAELSLAPDLAGLVGVYEVELEDKEEFVDDSFELVNLLATVL